MVHHARGFVCKLAAAEKLQSGPQIDSYSDVYQNMDGKDDNFGKFFRKLVNTSNNISTNPLTSELQKRDFWNDVSWIFACT